jgi:hypothetical protein
MKNTSPKIETIRTPDGKPFAKIRTDPRTGVKSVYDKLKTFKGTYRPQTNMTYDSHGRPVSKGNSLPAVVLDCVCQ